MDKQLRLIERLEKALRQIALLAEWQTTGPGKCDSKKLTAKEATSLRKSISDIARGALHEHAWFPEQETGVYSCLYCEMPRAPIAKAEGKQ